MLFGKKKKAATVVFPIEPDGTVRANGNKKGIFRLFLPEGWEYRGGSIRQSETSSRLFLGQCQITDNKDATISIRMGEAGTRPGEGLQVLLDTYSQQRAGVDYFNYDEMPDPMIMADVIANNIGSGLHAQGFHLVMQMNSPDPQPRLQEVYDRFERRANAMRAQVTDPFMGRVLRIYDFETKDGPKRMAVYIQLEAVKDMRGYNEFPNAKMLGGESAIQNAVASGTLPDGMESAQDFDFMNLTIPQRLEYLRKVQQGISGGTQWCYPDYIDYIATGTIYWCIEELVTFVAPAEQFDQCFGTWFMPFVDGLQVHEDTEALNLHVMGQETIKLHNVVPLGM